MGSDIAREKYQEEPNIPFNLCDSQAPTDSYLEQPVSPQHNHMVVLSVRRRIFLARIRRDYRDSRGVET